MEKKLGMALGLIGTVYVLSQYQLTRRENENGNEVKTRILRLYRKIQTFQWTLTFLNYTQQDINFFGIL